MNESELNDTCGFWVNLSDLAQVTEVRWFLKSVAIVIMIISVVGNQMVAWTIISSPQLRSTTNWYILNLSTADFVVGVFVIPYRTLEMLFDCETSSAILSASYCPLLRTVTNLCINVGINSVIVITVERYLAVVHPLAFQSRSSNKTNVIITVAIIWVFSFIVIIPEVLSDYVMQRVTMIGDLGVVSLAHCLPLSTTVTASLAYAILQLVLAYLLPIVFITATSIGIACKFRRLTRTNNSHFKTRRNHSCHRRDESKRKITRTVFIIAILYTLSWTPYNIFKMLILFGGLQDQPHELFITIVADLCSFASSAVSPVILFSTSVSFRQAFTSCLRLAPRASTPTYCSGGSRRRDYSRASSKFAESNTVSNI